MRALPTILVVDDDRDTADSLTMLLKSAGYAAEATYDARHAPHETSRSQRLLRQFSQF